MSTLKTKLSISKKLKKGDTVLKEFKTKDLGKNIAQYQHLGAWVKPKGKTKPTSVALSEETIQVLREKAAKKGIGYQTLLKMIVQEHLDKY